MTRIIQTEVVGKQRKYLTRAVVLALREFLTQKEPNAESRDMIAFIVAALESITANIDKTVTPWEKRDYWLKADKFRLQWEWTEQIGGDLREALFAENWIKIATLVVTIGEKLSAVSVPKRHRMGSPWVGAWEKIQK